MQVVTDLHLHSKYSRAVSKDMILPTMARVASQKGIDLLTTSDWTHPLWFKEIQGQLDEVAEGVYALKSEIRNPKSETNSNFQNTNDQNQVKFVLSTEISSIYSQGGKLRRIHNLVFSPSFAVSDKIIKEMTRRGFNLLADGRPIIGASSKELLELIMSIDERCMLIPCHIWTPHFGIYGSASGFDSLKEAFGELAENIYGIETGLSSDPAMNWQVKELLNRSILSFSDAHSPAKMGREATVMELEEVSYENLRAAFRRGDRRGKGDRGDKGEESKNRILYTTEFYPEEGKYHFSGHRNCKVSFGPEEIREKGTICPVCRKRMTEGVLFRVLQLADHDTSEIVEAKPNQYGLKWYTDKTKHHPPYVKLVPLLEIVAQALGATVASQKVKEKYFALISSCGDEFSILLKTSIDVIAKEAGERIAQGVQKVREGNIVISPGFDGEYGKVRIWSGEDEKKAKTNAAQMSFDM